MQTLNCKSTVTIVFMQDNPLHLRIGQIIERHLIGKEKIVLLKDVACGGNQHIPLFCSIEKSRETEYCNVDLMILKDNKIKVIIEIEESNIKPTQICGKFLTSALSSFYIHELRKNNPVEMDQSVTFIQIVDSSKLERRTQKFDQWNMLENSIKTILPIKGSLITKYLLLFGEKTNFDEDSPILTKLISEINGAIG